MLGQKQLLYSPSIDGLRAIAVIAVILNHLNHDWLRGGFSGVDVFFVISGFVVSASSASLDEGRIGPFMLKFYSRRLMRITPALVVCLLVTTLLSAMFIPQGYLSQSLYETGAFAAMGLSNFVLMASQGGYFSTLAEYNPFTHTWSLAVEEQFYVLFPLIFLPWLGGWKRSSAAALIFMSALSIASAGYFMSVNPASSFYMIWNRFWELALGVLLFQIMSLCGHSFREISASTFWTRLGSGVSLVILIFGLVSAKANESPLPAAIAPALGTLGLLGFLHGRSADPIGNFLSTPLLRFLGRISYSLYLWHWVILVLFRWTVGTSDLWSILAILSLTFGFSVLSYHFIENPLRTLSGRWSRLGAVAAGLMLVSGGFYSVTQIQSLQSDLSLSTVTRHRAEWYPEPSAAILEGSCRFMDVTERLEETSFLKKIPVDCPRSDHMRQIFLLGDSHAMAYRRMIDQVALRQGMAVYSYDRLGCPVFSFLRESAEAEGNRCHESFRKTFEHVLENARSGDVVFFASLRLPRAADQWVHFGWESVTERIFGEEGVKGRERGFEDALRILPPLASKNVKIIFEAPKPIFEVAAFRCSDWFNRSNPLCRYPTNVAKDRIQTLRQPVISAIDRIASSVPGVRIWDPLPVLCPDEFCEAVRGGRPLFFDADHLSGYANDLLATSFEEIVRD